MATRCSEVSTRQPRPISCGPATKNGSTMRSRASVQILVGAGKVAPGRLHSISQTRRISARVTSGGMMLDAAVCRAGSRRAEKLDRGDLSFTTWAGAARTETAAAASALSMGMFVRDFSWLVQVLALAQTAARLIDSDLR